MFTWLDLLLYTGAVYGISWGIAKSSLLGRPRAAVAKIPLLGELVQCIVCTSAWVAAGTAMLLAHSSLFSPSFQIGLPLDVVLLAAWAVAATWALARLFGDAS